MKNLNKYFDHTLLKPEASCNDIRKICAEAMEYEFASVCVNTCYTALAAQCLKDSPVKVAAVTGFPLGAASSAAKLAETEYALCNGAKEIDMVINIGALKEGRYDYVEDEISQIANVCHDYQALLKVIIETCLLTRQEIITACSLAEKASADFVKTSTGFSTAGARQEDVRLMKNTVGEPVGKLKIKASGGIKTLENALSMIKAGADRLGCSASVDIMKEYHRNS